MKQTILGLRAETSIHAGTGQNNGVIDLPIQREAHTGWPCVYGSAVKGAFRAYAEIRAEWGKDGKVKEVFGTADNEGSASQISMTDARLLLLPVRSLTGHFKLVTCPAILRRLQRDMQMMEKNTDWKIPQPAPQDVIGVDNDDIFLEEFRFSQKVGLPDDLVEALQAFGVENLKSQLLVMHNDDFAWFAKNATAVTPHIQIKDKEKKIVKNGALWYEESLPSDALLYTMLMGEDKHVDSVLSMFPEDKPFIQIGGNETVGMGWCKVEVVV